ncbi:hypothetical protein [Campylobacter concisus]|uniref:hypothetical protein n=2 Tax=Campylobacter concisus TaxID=199 RepID=UPI000CD8C9CB|nr:hypothetical protein [Campylobacter concisus]
MKNEKVEILLDEVNEIIDSIFRTCNKNGGTKKALENKKLNKEVLKDKLKSIFLKFSQIDDADFKSTILIGDETKELNEITTAFDANENLSLSELERAINYNLTSVKEAIYKFQNNNS